MIRVLGCITQQHDLRLVVLAALLAVFATATSYSMTVRGRATTEMRLRTSWVIASGLVAGAGIWGVHFVAMLAYRTSLPMGFAPGLTTLSALLGMGGCALGSWLALNRHLGGVTGGAVRGLAISAMHFTGVAAIEIPALPLWDSQLVIAAIAIGVTLGGVSGWFGMRRPGRVNSSTAIAAYVLAIVGVHFTAMAAVSFRPDPTQPVSGTVIAPFELAVMIATCITFIVTMALIAVLIDRYLARRAHGEAQRMRVHIAELEGTQKELKKVSDRLLRALHQADEASQAKSAFLASMSHELRTPLNAIIGFSDTMMQEIFGPLTERYKGYAHDINASGAHLLSLINDILDLSKLDAGQAELREEDFDLTDLVAESVRMVTGQAEKARIALTSEVAPGLPRIHADRRRIKQVLINLASNALKFTPTGGTVSISVFRPSCSGGVAFAVRDTGIGIAPADIPKAFERFGQVDSSMARKHNGTGLGLPLSKQLIELHGGTLTLESAVNVGTTVTVILPQDRLLPGASAAAA